ncbi:hypothetical protein AHF37_05977 [Paragonimus kellicotti]|nr:hypothetical protein AHF37_05977 [Paragonimus kellicotti]
MSKHLARIAQFLHKLFISPFKMNKEINVLKRPGSADAIYSKPPKISNTSVEGLLRVKKKMCAVLMMYCGWGYYGMQRSPTHPTIEGELSQALISCGYLEDMTGEAFKKIWFQRASKTDKSVSATGQVCSMLLPASEDVMQNLNAALPKHIRILDIIRATQSFCANTACSHRVYDYLFPTFALAPHDLAGGDTAHWCFRVSAETLTHANAVLHRFKGTHNFYNFTSGRYVFAFYIDVPKAPGLGLMLNQVVYTRYNEKFGHDGIHLPIDWTKYEDQMDAFKLEHIYDHIHKTEIEERSMLGWLDSLNIHSYTFRAPSCPTVDRSNLLPETAASPLFVAADGPVSEQTSLTESNQTISEPAQAVIQT